MESDMSAVELWDARQVYQPSLFRSISPTGRR